MITIDLILGDCRKELKNPDSNSVDLIFYRNANHTFINIKGVSIN